MPKLAAPSSKLPASITRSVIDISHWEDPIDFKKVAAAGIIAIIAKASQGATGVDPAYAKFKRAAGKTRLPLTLNQRRDRAAVLSTTSFLWGSYHFGTGGEVNAQVENYLSVAQPTDRELVCLDFEPNPNGATMTLNQAREFVSLVRERLGRYLVLYGGYWLKEKLNGKADDLLSKCPLWLAQYGPKAVLPPGWKKYTLWQYTDGEVGPEPHTVPGIGPCDRNQFNGTIVQLRKRWPFS